MAEGDTSGGWFQLPTTEFVIKTAWVVLLLAIALLGTFHLADTFGLMPAEVDIKSDGTTIRLEREGRGETEYLLMVHPQGWQNTRISVDPNDLVEFDASGSINIGLHRLLESINARHAYEAKLSACQSGTAPCRTALDSAFRQAFDQNGRGLVAPEDYLSPAEVESIRPRYAWSGPEGDPGDTTDRGWPLRTRRKIKPGLAYGRLLGIVRVGDDIPKRAEFGRIIDIGAGTVVSMDSVHAHGHLWLVVNDVWDDHNSFPEKFFVDNVGSFWVRVRVRHKKSLFGSRHEDE